MASSKFQALWNHPAGPKTNWNCDDDELLQKFCINMILTKSYSINYGPKLTPPLACVRFHFWAPTFKWGISIANLADSAKPPEKVSYPQQIAVTATGVIWSRYSTVITPHVTTFCVVCENMMMVGLQKNWNLFSVNIVMAGTGIYQLSRKIQHDYFSKEQPAVVTKE
ncbi:hypothetical protein SASPL_117034 [Salvia splendens]|uniref:Mitochondrial pyruvate carrier n=1 Tax=Salvia splendens TaxID=180675 RepID=A0A8X8XUT1_SALSN|nr:hypothetical protein SASPL_117034 [Salvia splendens]